METISTKLLEDIIRKGSYNFIGFAITPWHAHGIDCCVELLTNRGVEVKGLVIIGYNEQSGYVINPTHFINENELTFYYGQKAPDYKNIIKNLIHKLYLGWNYNEHNNVRADFYLASAWHLNLELYKTIVSIKPKAIVEFIKFEEGLATYFPTSDSCRSIWLSIRDTNLLIKIPKFIFRYLDKYAQRNFEKKVRFTNLNLFFKNNHGLVPNTNAIQLYRSILNQRLCKQKEIIDYSIFENSVIVCTMAYPRNEIVESDDVNVLQKVIKRYQQLGYRVVLKPHPREKDIEIRYSNIGCAIFMQNTVTLESILYRVKSVSAIVSFSSTALISSRLLFGSRAVCLLKLIDINKYGNSVKMEMESFLSCFSDMVEMPMCIEDIL